MLHSLQNIMVPYTTGLLSLLSQQDYLEQGWDAGGGMKAEHFNLLLYFLGAGGLKSI